MSPQKLIKSIRSIWNEIFKKVHCHINPVSYAKKIGVKIGKDCRLISVNFGSEPYLITLGNHVSATATTFITHDGGAWVFRDKLPKADIFDSIKIGDNVFLGYGTIVLPGITVGNNVVIGAGSVVTRDIPSDCVAVGVPARPIKSAKEYFEKCMTKVVYTKDMKPNEKRLYLKRKFRI
jgi:acetyltransferase-like isoleucine patch superfamily enzyme